MPTNLSNEARLAEGHGLEILDCRIGFISVTSMRYRNREKIVHRPASIGNFTINELQHVLTTIQTQPFRDTHYFIFDHGRYLVKIYADTDKS